MKNMPWKDIVMVLLKVCLKRTHILQLSFTLPSSLLLLNLFPFLFYWKIQLAKNQCRQRVIQQQLEVVVSISDIYVWNVPIIKIAINKFKRGCSRWTFHCLSQLGLHSETRLLSQTLCSFSAAGWCAGKMFNRHLETARSTT